MKKLNLTYVFVLLAMSAILAAACRKEKATVLNAAKTAKEFAEVFGPKLQTLKMSATKENTFTLKGGTIVTIPAGAFKINGIAVTSGDVVIEAFEMFKRSDVVFSGTNTNHISGAPLASDGFIYLNASINGVKVDQALTVNIKIAIPTSRTGATQIWEGVEKVGADNQMAWQAPAQRANGIAIKAEVGSTNGAFVFDMGNLGWINCDVFYSYTNPKTTVRVELHNNPGDLASFRGFTGETFVFFCAKGSNVAAQLYTKDGTNKVKSYDNSMPIGVQGKFLSFSIKDGKYYYAQQETTIVANQTINLTLAETTEAEIQAVINALNTY